MRKALLNFIWVFIPTSIIFISLYTLEVKVPIDTGLCIALISLLISFSIYMLTFQRFTDNYPSVNAMTRLEELKSENKILKSKYPFVNAIAKLEELKSENEILKSKYISNCQDMGELENTIKNSLEKLEL